MMLKKTLLILSLFTTMTSFAGDGRQLANDLGISAYSKASSQWNRIFKKTKKMKKYGIDTLNKDEQAVLRIYLMDHAADSDTPEAAGI